VSFEPAGHQHRGSCVGHQLVRPVNESPRALGRLYLRTDMRLLGERRWWHGKVAAAVLAMGCLAAILVVVPFHRIISGPIARLRGRMREVTEDKRLAIRAERHHEDEIGRVIDGSQRDAYCVRRWQADSGPSAKTPSGHFVAAH